MPGPALLTKSGGCGIIKSDQDSILAAIRKSNV